MYTYDRLAVPTVINASGKMTHLGGSALHADVRQAMAEAGAAYVDVAALKVRAGDLIAEWAGAEAGWITSGAAAGIAIMTAACIAGADSLKVGALPGADWEPRSVLLQAGHAINFGAPVEQMVRLGGGRPVLVGSANLCTVELLRGAIDPRTAAILYVQSHHAVQKGMVGLDDVIRIAAASHVPVLVDAAAEEDLRRYIASGADLVTYSGGKAFEGPTSGFIVGRAELVHACRAQDQGIARPMKVGKEEIMGLLTALERYLARDESAELARQQEIVNALLAGLGDLPNTRVAIVGDEAGRRITRLAVTPSREALGFDAEDLMMALQVGTPRVFVRGHLARIGTILLDPRPLRTPEVPEIVRAIHQAYERLRRAKSS